MLEEISAIIKEHGYFGVTSHLGPEADAIGSQLALKRMLESLGKEVWAVLRDPVPETLKFLPDAEEVRAPGQVPHERIEAWFVLDCGQLNRIGQGLYERVKDHPLVVNIDHHLDNPRFGHLNWVAGQASTTMLIHHLARHLGVEIGPELATCLYAGIVADTDSFRNANVGSEVLHIASELLGHGARAREISINLYERRGLPELRVLGYMLAHARLRDGVIWSSIPQSLFHQTGASMGDTERLAEELRTTDGIRVAVLFKELVGGKVKVSLRSKDGVDVSRIARAFGGGGHRQAAGCLVSGELANVEAAVLEEVDRALYVFERGGGRRHG